jgi:hypothetical protein
MSLATPAPSYTGAVNPKLVLGESMKNTLSLRSFARLILGALLGAILAGGAAFGQRPLELLKVRSLTRLEPEFQALR